MIKMNGNGGSNATAESLDTDRLTSSDYLQYVQSQKAQPTKPGATGQDIEAGQILLAADEKMIRIREIIEQIRETVVPVLFSVSPKNF